MKEKDELVEYAGKHDFKVTETADATIIAAPDKVWSWVIHDGLLSQYAVPYQKALNRHQCHDDAEALSIALASMKNWLTNAEKC